MHTSLPAPFPLRNQLLFALGGAEYALLLPQLERVQLAPGKVLYEADATIKHAYFLLSGLASLFGTTESGGMIEVAEVSNEGVLGLPVVLGTRNSLYRAEVQITASAMRIDAGALRREFNRGGQLQNVLLSYLHTRLTQVSQAMLCNHFHTVKQRLSRWLLETRDYAHANRFQFTQQQLADILGTPRTNITMCVGILRRNNLINCARGQITILDRHGLEANACECYGTKKRQNDSFLAA